MTSGADSAARREPPDGGDREGAVVLLVGFMASGKSAVGRVAAARLERAFVDTDEAIEAAHGPISAVFARGGEALFREVERAIVLDIIGASGTDGAVVALGGGAVTIPAVRAALSTSPLVVWLTAPADVLWERARRAPQGTRPLADGEAAFRALLAERERLYRDVADAIVINDGSRTLEEVGDEVVAIVRTAGTTPGGALGSRAGGEASQAGVADGADA